MGIFDKVKNAVTGGAAEVSVHVGEAEVGQPVEVHVQAVANSDVDLNSVYLLVRSVERARFREREFDDDGFESETESGSQVVFDQRFDIAEAQSLSEGEQYAWEAEFTIPATANPSFDGQIIDHTWMIQAGLDATGNDPDSGWKNFLVR